jgi:hypothetical protein
VSATSNKIRPRIDDKYGSTYQIEISVPRLLIKRASMPCVINDGMIATYELLAFGLANHVRRDLVELPERRH